MDDRGESNDLDERIRARAASTDLAALAQAEGITTVALDVAGSIIETTAKGIVTGAFGSAGSDRE